MSKRPHSPKARHEQQPLKRCLSGCEIAASVEKASNDDINLPQQLCDDSLLHVLSYADTSSLVHFTRGTSNAMRSRFHSALENKIWKDAFHNHHLAPLLLAENSDPPEYYSVLRQRLALFSNLCGKSTRRNKQLKHSYNLPSRFFNFVPILPDDLMHYPPTGNEDSNANDISFQVVNSYQDEAVNHVDLDHDDDLDQSVHQLNVDPPPVEFSCDSYSLTSSGTGQELVFLNPFSGTVEVRNVLDNAIGNDESILEHVMLNASDRIPLDAMKQHENSGIIAKEAFHHSSMYDTPPKQVLYSVDDYFDLDLNEYFGAHTPFQHRRSSGNVTSDWVGVDSHSAPLGTVIGAARILTMESEEGEEVCTEVFAWNNFDRETGEVILKENVSSKYCCKHVVRAAGSFYFLDVCANKFKVFAVFQAGSCPFDAIAQHDIEQRGRARNNFMLEEINDNDSVVNEDGGPIRMSRTIFCLPLIECDDSKPTPDSIKSKFPKPDAAIKAQYPVASFSIDTTGNHLVVGSINGTVEIWDTTLSDKPRRSQLLSVRQFFIKRHRAMTLETLVRKTSNNDELSNSNDKLSDNEQDAAASNIEFSIVDDTALLSIGEDFPHKHPTSKISQIYLPRHLPVQKCGFVTKQRSAEFGTTLLLWQTSTMFLEQADKSCGHFQITAMINVPILAQCHPEVHFDGRRLLVFGKDHIGLIVLVYHVLGTRFDQDGFNDFEKAKFSAKGEESGGVLNLIDDRRVKFVNRIRHAGLDGLEYFDSMLMTANERYVVINTKAGHLIGCDGRNASEGLLVIDLEDARDDRRQHNNRECSRL